MKEFIVQESIANESMFEKFATKLNQDFIVLLTSLTKNKLMDDITGFEIQQMLIQHLLVVRTCMSDHFLNHANYLIQALENGQEIEIYEWIDECQKVQLKFDEYLKHEYSEEYMLNLYKSIKHDDIKPLLKKKVI